MSWKRPFLAAGLSGLVALGSMTVTPTIQGADRSDQFAANQRLIEHRRQVRAQRHALAEQQRRLIDQAMMREQMLAQQMMMEMMRRQRVQLMIQSFLVASQQTGTWNSCSGCGSLVSPYAVVGQNCPFCGTRWGSLNLRWVGP
jgi:predicted dithiol-disulfide oxidoreductase (DUF899 family)